MKQKIKKRLHENKNSREMLISTSCVIKHNAKVGKLVLVLYGTYVLEKLKSSHEC